MIGAGKKRDGVYHLAGAVIPQANHVGKIDDRDLWHRRMGHPSSKILSLLSDIGVFSSSISALEECCDICFKAKQTRVLFSESSNKADDLFSLIHCNVWGPYRTKSTCEAVYFLTIVDDFSRALWTHLLIEKSSVSVVLKNFFAWVNRQFGKQVKCIRTDNGTEFMCMRSYFSENGITHQTSCVDTPQQNRRVERKHRHILNIARSLLFQAKLPTRFWGERIQAATHLINRTPSILLKGKTPYEILFQKLPSYDDIRTFACLCYARTVQRSNDKFEDRSARCIFLGYPFGKKGWLLFDLHSEKMFVSRDVIFYEDVFPYNASFAHDIDTRKQGELLSLDLVQHHLSPLEPVADIVSVTKTVTDTNSATETVVVIETEPDESQTATIIETITNKESTAVTDSATTPTTVADTEAVVPPVVEVLPSPVEEQLGRGHRKSKPSVLLKEYVTNTALLDKPLTTHLSPITCPQVNVHIL